MYTVVWSVFSNLYYVINADVAIHQAACKCFVSIYRPLCYWLFGCAGGLVIGMDFGLFELVC